MVRESAPGIPGIPGIDELIRQDPGGRGLAGAAGPNPLREAAESLRAASRVLIATGFCIPSAMVGETDGPPGAAVLARCLLDSGRGALVLTDIHSAALVEAACSVYGAGVDIRVSPAEGEASAAFVRAVLDDYRPSHIVAIERPGAGADGLCRSMRGDPLGDRVPSFSGLFDRSAPGGVPRSIAIGDGGNELGMGGIPRELMAAVPQGALIAAVDAADMPIVAGVSNWGAWGLAAAFCLLEPGLLLPGPDKEREALEAVVRAGAVDGATRKRSLSVDGLPLDEYLGVVRSVCGLWEAGIA